MMKGLVPEGGDPDAQSPTRTHRKDNSLNSSPKSNSKNEQASWIIERQKGRSIMNALFQMKLEMNPSLRSMKYSDFVKDPLGFKKKKQEEEERKRRKVDGYDRSVRFSKNQDNSQVIQEETELDIEIANQEIYEQQKRSSFVDNSKDGNNSKSQRYSNQR